MCSGGCNDKAGAILRADLNFRAKMWAAAYFRRHPMGNLALADLPASPALREPG